MLLASWHAAHSPSRGPAPARPYGPRVVRPSQIHTPRRSTQRLDRATRGRGCYQPPRHGGETLTRGLRAARDAVAVSLVPPCSTDGVLVCDRQPARAGAYVLRGRRRGCERAARHWHWTARQSRPLDGRCRRVGTRASGAPGHAGDDLVSRGPGSDEAGIAWPRYHPIWLQSKSREGTKLSV